MKRRLPYIMITSLLVFAMIFSLLGCNSASDAPTTADEPTVTDNIELKIGTGHTAGTNYQFLVATAKIISTYVDGATGTPVVTTGGTENLAMLGAGEIDAGGATTSGINAAIAGDKSFGYDAVDDLVVLYTQFADYWQFILPADSDINTFEDLKGRKVSLDGKGSGGYTTNLARLAAIGVDDPEDYFDCYYLSSAESLEALTDGSIDCFIYAAGIGGVALQMAESRTGLKLISLSDEQISAISASSPVQSPKVLPAGSYKGVDYDVKTVGGCAALTTRMGLMSDEMAYNIVKALEENREDLVAVNKAFDYASAEITVKDISGVLPLHPGAEKYFKELGLM